MTVCDRCNEPVRAKVAPVDEWDPVCIDNADGSFYSGWWQCGPTRPTQEQAQADAEYVFELVRAAEIQERRGWSVCQFRSGGPWIVHGPEWLVDPMDRGNVICEGERPSLALIAADEWMKAHEQRGNVQGRG